MADSMIERVARAIAGADPEQQGQIDDSEMGEYFWEKYRDHYVVLARAAIEAMRSAPEHLAADLRLDGQHIASYHDIIDAALNEQVSG